MRTFFNLEEKRRLLQWAIQVAENFRDGHKSAIETARAFASVDFGITGTADISKIFDALNSETVALPLGDVRQHWNREALRLEDIKIEAIEARYRPKVTTACAALINILTPQLAELGDQRELPPDLRKIAAGIEAPLHPKVAAAIVERFPATKVTKSSIADEDLASWAVEAGLSPFQLLEMVGPWLATSFALEKLNYLQCDAIVNQLQAHVWQRIASKEFEGPPPLFYEVFLAFDAGEYLRAGQSADEPVELYTKPLIAKFLLSISAR